MAEIVKLGSLLYERAPAKVGMTNESLGDVELSIGDTRNGDPIQWVVDGDKLIADRILVFGVSGTQLSRQGLDNGKIMQIDGSYYLCRLLHGGENKDDPNEWDDLLARMGIPHRIWHHKGRFWCQELKNNGLLFRVCRGGRIGADWGTYFYAMADPLIGWRPVLEKLQHGSRLTKDIIGRKVRIVDADDPYLHIEGTLTGFSDYDLEVSALSWSVSPKWIVRPSGISVVNRESIFYVSI